MADSGQLVLASFISPFRAERARVRKLHEDTGLPFLEVFVDVPLDVAESRDPKGLYRKARAGEIQDFTGINQPYESPESPELNLPNAELSLQDAASNVIKLLRKHALIQ